MKMLLLWALAATLVGGCTTTTTASDFVFLKTQVGPARCTVPANGACASCETACPALHQALCTGGSNVAATDRTAAACIKAASCVCVGRGGDAVPATEAPR
jgi:hypothetical protein